MRRSLRLRDKATDNSEILAPSVESSSADWERSRSEDDEEEAPQRRARKKAKRDQGGSSKRKKMPKEFKKVRGKFGLLEKLGKDAPLDIFFEIFMHLDPGDLLRLARTSKDLRNTLMRKSTGSIWSVARSNVKGLPPLPDNLTEPQYAHLVFFDSYCHNCLQKRRCETVFWAFRMRCCKTCTSELFTTWGEQQLSLNLDHRFKNILPSAMVLGREISKLPLYGYHCLVQLSDVMTYKAKFDALPSDEERTSWIDGMMKVRAAEAQHASLYAEWCAARSLALSQERQAVIYQRKIDILVRLDELGWREEARMIIDSLWGWDKFSQHKLVNQNKKLTDRSWNNMKKELVLFLADHKKLRQSPQGCPCCSKHWEEEYSDEEDYYWDSEDDSEDDGLVGFFGC